MYLQPGHHATRPQGDDTVQIQGGKDGNASGYYSTRGDEGVPSSDTEFVDAHASVVIDVQPGFQVKNAGETALTVEFY